MLFYWLFYIVFPRFSPTETEFIILNTAELIDALLTPDTYPHPVEVITTIETHISIVFLTGQFAYKLKKPVDFGFLDFSTLHKRKQYCFLEVELNQRTAPDLYIGVNQISLKNHKLQICDAEQDTTISTKTDNDVIDYLVKMRQFDPNMVLGRLLKQGVLNAKMIEDLTNQIVEFHCNAKSVNQTEPYGNPKIQLQPMLDNFPTLQKHFTDSQTQTDLTGLLDWTHHKYNQLKEQLSQRKADGFVKACHGDLHLDNITLIDDHPVLFDGIEFNEAFRWIDTISDLAFLLIDLEFKQQKTASYTILSLYLSKTLDYNGLNLLNFYQIYRTLVRAKITTLRAQQLPSKSIQQNQVELTAKNYIQQALNYSQTPNQPKCILINGVSGSGKSHFAYQLQQELNDFNAIVINSDRIRKTLFGLAAHDRPNELQKQSLYSTEMNKKTYQAMAENTAICLKNGFNVILDATFLKQEHRQRFYDLALDNNAQSYLFSITTELQTSINAIHSRQQLNDNPSDADIAVMQKQRENYQPIHASENALILKNEDLRKVFPLQTIQKFLNLPIT